MSEIDINEFKPNSRKYHLEQEQSENSQVPEKKVEKVIQGSGTKQKRGIGKRFIDIFIDENVSDVKTYLFYDVLVPAIKENFADLVNSAVNLLLFGEVARRPARRQGGNGTGSKINYGGYFNSNQRPERLPRYERSRVAHNFDDVYFNTRGEAELVLDGMMDILSDYKQVTVADFYDLAGVSTEFTDNKYGWTDLRGTSIKGSPSRGYWIELPKCVALD